MKKDGISEQKGETLWLIPARGGSKGIPDKNLKPFCGKSLVSRTVKLALECALPSDTIFVSTDSIKIKEEAERNGLEIPFLRNPEYASDTASTYSVIREALKELGRLGKYFERLVLLQPTSPLRRKEDVEGALKLWNTEIDMVVSVTLSQGNPYFNLFEQDDRGFLKISKGNGGFTRRQDAPKVWEYNGAVYVITTPSLLQQPISEFKKVVPYEMPASRSIDLDTPEDWEIAEFIFQKNKG